MQWFNTKKNQLLASLLITIVFYVVVLPFNEHLAFVQPYVSNQAESFALALKTLGFPIYFALIYFIISFTKHVINGDSFYRSWLKTSLIYLCIMSIFFILLYPGHWVGDEFSILEAVRQYDPYSWQSYLTNIYYTLSLYLIPTGVGIVVIQLSILSLITGYIISLSRNLFRHKHTHYLLLLPFITFPVILNNLYPLRLTVFSYLLLLLFAQILFLHAKVLIPKHPRIMLLQVAFVLSIICFWRSEGLIYLILLPIFARMLGLLNRSALRQKSTYVIYALSLVFIGLTFWITSVTTRADYQITATLNPMSTMIQGKLQGEDIDKELAAVDRVINLAIVRQYPSYTGLPAYWNGALREDYFNHLHGYNLHIFNIFIQNFNLFIDNRIQVFLLTNSFGTQPSTGYVEDSYDISQFYNSDKQSITKIQNFYLVNKLSHPISLQLKHDITTRLLLVDNQYKPSIFAKIVWSIIPTAILLLALTVAQLFRRHWLHALMGTMLLTHGILIFLTAPASYFMYYFPIYLVGNFILAIVLLRICEARLPSLYCRLHAYLQLT